jgi:hypothetical protein
MKTISTFNALHLGDNLVHLHFLRKLALAYPEINFRHGAPEQHLAQLHPLAADLPNLELTDISVTALGALNAWRGVENHWYQHHDRLDFARYHVHAWFPVLAQRMGGLRSPFTRPEDMLFDYPALESEAPGASETKRILIVNCPPMSGQWAGYNSEQMNQLAALLWSEGHAVVSVMPTGIPEIPSTIEQKLDVTAIGRFATHADVIIGCVTGPMWPCLNVWNAARPLRIHLLDTENVTFCGNTVHANSTALVPEILKDHGFL